MYLGEDFFKLNLFGDPWIFWIWISVSLPRLGKSIILLNMLSVPSSISSPSVNNIFVHLMVSHKSYKHSSFFFILTSFFSSGLFQKTYVQVQKFFLLLSKFSIIFFISLSKFFSTKISVWCSFIISLCWTSHSDYNFFSDFAELFICILLYLAEFPFKK